MVKNNEVEYCACEKSSSTYTAIDDFKQWDVCSDCNKPIEGTIEFFNPSENDSEPLE